jgi:hypothetical protein
MIDFFGHIGYGLIAAGMFLLSRKDKNGWILRFAGEGVWVVLGFALGLTSIWTWGLIFLGIDITGYVKWLASERKQLHSENDENVSVGC